MVSSVLVTGSAGFIGFHLCQRLAREGIHVYGVDNLNNYYDPTLKEARLAQLKKLPNFTFLKADIGDRETMARCFTEWKPEVVVNLAAQAGVRHSLTHPHDYTASNIEGFLVILEACRHNGVKHLVYASSSSVYGANTKLPFSVEDNVDQPINLYAASKKANELMAHSYSHLYNMETTGLRFFTVYGPWGRPDMALFKFLRAMYAGQPIDVYNNGDMQRDFTYVDDIVDGIARVIPRYGDNAPPSTGGFAAPYRIYNIGNNQPENLLEAIGKLEEAAGVKAILNLMPMQPGDVKATYADIDALTRDTGFAPRTPFSQGVKHFVAWYQDYFDVASGQKKKVS